jgi:hypothetical protein
MGLRFKTESHGELQECGARRAISPAFISSPALLHQHHAQPRATARFLQNAESVICMGVPRCIGVLPVIKVCSRRTRRSPVGLCAAPQGIFLVQQGELLHSPCRGTDAAGVVNGEAEAVTGADAAGVVNGEAEAATGVATATRDGDAAAVTVATLEATVIPAAAAVVKATAPEGAVDQRRAI